MPKIYVQEFNVSGRGAFPYDMLRYDRCWPAQEVESSKLGSWPRSASQEPLVIKLKRYVTSKSQQPTFGRWSSFGWIVDQNSVKITHDLR